LGGDRRREQIVYEGALMADQTPADRGTHRQPPAARRSTAKPIAGAIDLGWRVASLYALRPSTLTPPSPVNDDMLLNRRSLSPADRLELEVRAIAGAAQRIGIGLQDAQLVALLALVDDAVASPEGEQAFRDAIAGVHLSFDKQLWTREEASGKAYELGNFISDTWNRVLWPRTTPDPQSELHEVFGAVRVQRMKLLLDDLQARVDPIAAHAITNHLDQWRDRVASAAPVPAGAGAAANPTPEGTTTRFAPVERQTIIWRQMLTGDKEPEAYISHVKRMEVRDELTKQIWRRYRRPLPWIAPIVVVLGIVVGSLYAHHQDDAKSLLGVALTLTGALGLTRATMIGTVRRGLQGWGDLMWSRALAVVICRETSVLDELYPPVVSPSQRIAERFRWR
jgi:hypothetical protein